MPWCSTCECYLAPPTVSVEGACPRCGGGVAVEVTRPEVGDGALPPIPWHLKLLATAVAAYLLLRAWQGVAWIADHL